MQLSIVNSSANAKLQLRYASVVFRTLVTFEETLKGDVGRIEWEAGGRVFSGKTVEAVGLGRLNVAGSMRIFEIWA